MRTLIVGLLLLSAALSGCASSGGGSGPDRNRIQLWELQEVQDLTAYEAVQRLRPAWLRVRTTGGPVSEGGYGVAVHLDGSRQSDGVEFLRTISAADIREMQYMDGTTATTRFGTGYANGVILVTTLR